MPISDKDLIKEIRENVIWGPSADRHNRDAYRDNTQFLIGDQWDPLEATKRRNKRLMLTADQLNAPVDQIVNQVRQNKPGPAVSPSGGGADKDDAEIFAGLMRRIDYDNRSWVAFEGTFENATGGNFGCFEMDVEYQPRSFKRKITVKFIPDANETVFFDPSAIEKDRSDADWAFQIKKYTRAKYQATFGKTSISKMGKIDSLMDYFRSTDTSLAGWVTKDEIQVVKYWRVDKTVETLRLYSDGVARYDSERDTIPAGVIEDKTQNTHEEENRQLTWYLCDGVDILKKGEWEGMYIPLFPCYGREKWHKNKRILMSMIQLAKQAQQAFNYAFTGAIEVLALSTKAPWVGLLGQFKSKWNQWKNSNTDTFAYLEFDEVPLANGQTYITPPQRQLGEPPVQSFIAFCQICINAIQRATSVFDPSLGKQKSDQSGRAIQELQQQSQEGNFHWSDNLTICLSHYYRALLDLIQKEYDAPQVVDILRADKTPLTVEINKDFDGGMDVRTGKKITKHYKIAKGNYSVTVAIGPSADSQLLANESKITQLLKVLPPELIAQAADIFIKLQNYGPLGDQLAERLTPPQYRDPQDPNAAAAHLAQAMQQNQQLQAVVQKLQMAISTKQPELEVRKWIAAVQAVAGIEEAKLKIGDTQADREQDLISQSINLSHDEGQAAAARVHDLHMQAMEQSHEAQQNTQAQDADAEQEPAEGTES